MLDRWADGDAYQAFMASWSRVAGAALIRWLDLPRGLRWLDVGCGTGALSEMILAHGSPRSVLGVDRSEGYVEYATRRVSDIRACFEVGDAQALAADGDTFDVAVSGLVLNFVPNPGEMLREMSRVVVPGGCVGVYVWDYGEGMEMLRRFWDAAVALDPAAEALDEGRRFPICRREALGEALERAGLDEVETSAIIVPAQFESFEAFWSPFLGGQGPAPGYAVGLDDDARARLKERIREEMPPQTDVGLRLDLRAWAARGVVGHTA